MKRKAIRKYVWIVPIPIPKVLIDFSRYLHLNDEGKRNNKYMCVYFFLPYVYVQSIKFHFNDVTGGFYQGCYAAKH